MLATCAEERGLGLSRSVTRSMMTRLPETEVMRDHEDRVQINRLQIEGPRTGGDLR